MITSKCMALRSWAKSLSNFIYQKMTTSRPPPPSAIDFGLSWYTDRNYNLPTETEMLQFIKIVMNSSNVFWRKYNLKYKRKVIIFDKTKCLIILDKKWYNFLDKKSLMFRLDWEFLRGKLFLREKFQANWMHRSWS